MTTTSRTLSPLGVNLHIRLSKVAETTAGGLWLPETMREQWQQGEVLAAGPGLHIPFANGLSCRSVVWPERGDSVLFSAHSLRLISKDEGVIPETDLLAMIGVDGLVPLNDLLLCSIEAREEETRGGIVLADESQRRPRSGRVLAWGPGRLVTRGPRRGTRLSVTQILGVDEACLQKGPVLHWGPDAEVFDVGRESTEAVLVKAGTVDCYGCDNTGSC